jgi:hypothetical protein
VELELSSKGRTRLEQILGGYAADGRIDTVLYLVPNRTIGNPVLAAARRLGIDDLIRVQLVQDDSVQPRGGAARSHERVPRDRSARGRSGGARVAERGL